MAFAFAGAFLFFAMRACTRSNISSSMMAGMPLGMTTSPYLYSPMYLRFFRMMLTPPILKGFPFFVFNPRLLRDRVISLMLSPLS